MKVGSILRDFRERQIGISGNNILRFNHKLLRKLVCQENITYKKRLKFDKVKSRIYYESGKIYYENYRQCIITCGFQGDPQIAYNIPSVEQPEKIVDCIFCHSPSILTKKCADDDVCRPSLLALTEKNRLLRLDFETGKVLQSVNLSDRNRFRHISWETAAHSVVLKSIYYSQRNNNNRRHIGHSSETRRFAFMVFDVHPLLFRVHFEIRAEVFSEGVRDAQVMDGLLLVESNGTVRIYSLQDVLSDIKISNSDSGGPDNGLPVNVLITELPPVLLTVNCVDNDLAFDGYPWLYISRIIRSRDLFKVSTVESHQVVGNGLLEYPSNRIEPEGAIFHEDNSGRIIHYSATELRVLKLYSSADNEIRELHADYGISFDETKSEEPTIRFTSFGRVSTRNARLGSVSSEAYKHSLISFHYEDELDLLTMLITEPSSYDSTTVHGSVRMYDNATGKLIKRFKLDHEWEEDDEHTFVLDCDVLVHIINRPRLCNRCYLYKLTRTDDYDRTAPVVIKKHIKNAFSTTYIF